MVCLDFSVKHCKHPTWSRVGMEITPDELRKVLESKDYQASILETIPDLGCIILALGMASLVVYFIYWRVTRRRSICQGQGEGPHCKGDLQKLRHGFELQERVLVKMDAMEQRIAALEDFLRCMWGRRTMDRKTYPKNDTDKRDALRFSDCSD